MAPVSRREDGEKVWFYVGGMGSIWVQVVQGVGEVGGLESSGDPFVAARLIQAARAELRSQGVNRFFFWSDNPEVIGAFMGRFQIRVALFAGEV